MNRREFIKKGSYLPLGLLLNISCEKTKSNTLDKASSNQSLRENILLGRIERNRDNYRKIQWILNRDAGVYGAQPGKDVKSLEQSVFTDKNPLSTELTEWETTTLAKFSPIKKLIEKHSPHYNINPMWATMFLTFESSLKPTDHNKLSEDFGLGQIKRSSEKLAKKLGTNIFGQFYSPDLKEEKSIFDPETNIIMAFLLTRYNIERNKLKNSDQAYAVYVHGTPGLDGEGNLTKESGEKLNAFHQRYDYYKNIIPLFKLEKKEIASIKNEDTKNLLNIYHTTSNPEEIYRQELDYFLNDLEKNLKGDARSVLVYDDCSTFSRTLDMVWNSNQKENYRRLFHIGKKLLTINNEDLQRRVMKTTSLLMEVAEKRFQ